MGKTCDFMDNAVYGVEDMNNLRAGLLTKGVLTDSANSCKASLVGENVKITQGQALMTDGSRIVIDAEGVTVGVVSGGKNYVYFKRNETTNTIDVVCSLTAPAANDLPIAEVSDGVITDKRVFAQPKAAYTPAVCVVLDETVSATGTAGAWVQAGSISLNPGYNMLLIQSNRDDGAWICYDIINQKIFSSAQYMVSEKGGKKCIQTYYSSNKYYVINPDLTVSVYATRSDETSISVSIQGFAFYGGMR